MWAKSGSEITAGNFDMCRELRNSDRFVFLSQGADPGLSLTSSFDVEYSYEHKVRLPRVSVKQNTCPTCEHAYNMHVGYTDDKEQCFPLTFVFRVLLVQMFAVNTPCG